MKFAAGALLTASAFILFATPAVADTSEQDHRFLATMKSIGWHIEDPTTFTGWAHMVCNEGLAHGVSWREMQATLINMGHTRTDADLFIFNAIDVYCPEYAAITADEIEEDLWRS